MTYVHAGDIVRPMTTEPLIYLQTQRWNVLSMAIRFATRSVLTSGQIGPSHAGFVCGDVYLSAQGDGVRERGRDPGSYLWLFKGPGVQEAYWWARTQLGKPYDYGALFGLALDRDWRDDGQWFCSELVAAAMEHAGQPLFNPDTPVYRITPRDILLSSFVTMVGTSKPISKNAYVRGGTL